MGARDRRALDRNALNRRMHTRSLPPALVFVMVLIAGCSADGEPATDAGFQGFEGCRAGAGSAIVFLQRTLDQAGSSDAADVAVQVPGFDDDVRAMMLRAQEVHCTEDGFNTAVIARVDELESAGPGGAALIAVVRERGLGSLDPDRGGLISLPGTP